MPIECAQGDQPVRCPNRGFCARHPSAVPSGGGVFVVAGCVSVVCRWWWCKESRDVVWWGVVRCGEMWRCDVVTSGEMWCDVVTSGACHQKCYNRITKYYSVLQGSTSYYKVLQGTTLYSKVLQSITPHCQVLQSTTPHFYLQHFARSNLWDSKHTGSTTFMLQDIHVW